MPKPAVPFDPTNLLLGLAWLGELDRQQIRRLWFPDKSDSTVEKALSALRREKLITLRSWSLRDEQRQITVPQPARWSLTAAGHARIKVRDQYPSHPAETRRKGLIAHDARTTEVIVRLIELARSGGLSGVFVARELRLNPKKQRPVCDALVVIQLGAYDRLEVVPWSGARALLDEERLRYAVEADNDSEPLAVIQAKAEAYRKLSEDLRWMEWWRQRYGPLPLPLWVAPTEERALAIHAHWKQAWPRGEWYVASDESLADNRLLHWKAGDEKLVELKFRKPRAASATPSAPAPRPEQAPRPQALEHQTAPGVSQQSGVAASPQRPETAPIPQQSVSTPGPPQPASPGDRIVELFPPPGRRTVRLPPPVAAEVSSRAQRVAGSQSRQAIVWSGLWRTVQKAWAALIWLFKALIALGRGLVAAIVWYIDLDEYDRRSFHFRCLTALAAMALLASSAYWQRTGWPLWVTDPMAALTSSWQAAGETAPTASEVTLAPSTTPQPACPLVRVTATKVNLRAEAGRQGKVLRKLRVGEVLVVLDCQGVPLDNYTWWQIVGEDGTQGWAATNWLEAVR